MWGLDFENITYVDYYKNYLVMLQKQSDKQADIRQIECAILNFSGFGVKEPIQPQNMRKIPLIDVETNYDLIKNDEQALEIINRILKNHSI